MTDLSKSENSADQPTKKVATLFDLRLIIGALFTLYGIVLIIVGFTDGTKELHKASGIRINLWAGIGMLVTGLLFLLWMKLTGDGHDRPERERNVSDVKAQPAGNDSKRP